MPVFIGMLMRMRVFMLTVLMVMHDILTYLFAAVYRNLDTVTLKSAFRIGKIPHRYTLRNNTVKFFKKSVSVLPVKKSRAKTAVEPALEAVVEVPKPAKKPQAKKAKE